MNFELTEIKNKVYDRIGLQLSKFANEPEGKEYEACRFELNGLTIICRNSKITPKKVGQFVTFWKRNKDGITEPMNISDRFDFYVINVSKGKLHGQIVLPKSVLVEKGIVSTSKKEGKRGFRVYPPWDIANNKQAGQTQKWQLDYFYSIDNITDFKKVIDLYNAR